MHHRHEFGHRIDLGDDVRAVGKAHQPGPRSEQTGQGVGLEATAGAVHLPLAHDDAVRREAAPDAAVGLVVLVGHNDLVASRQAAPECLGQHIGVLRGRWPEMQPVGRYPEVDREPAIRLVHPLAGLAGGRIGTVGLHLQAPIVGTEPANDRLTGVRTTRILEKGRRCQRRFGKGREAAADEFEIERHWTTPGEIPVLRAGINPARPPLPPMPARRGPVGRRCLSRETRSCASCDARTRAAGNSAEKGSDGIVAKVRGSRQRVKRGDDLLDCPGYSAAHCASLELSTRLDS